MADTIAQVLMLIGPLALAFGIFIFCLQDEDSSAQEPYETKDDKDKE